MQQEDWNGFYQQPEQKGFAIASLVLGILSLVLCCMYGGFLGILGLIFGIISLAKKESRMGMAIAGIITSAFGLLYGIIMVMVTAMAIRYGISEMDEQALFQMMEKMYGIEEQDTNSNMVQDIVEDTEQENTETQEENPFAEKNYVLEDGSVVYFHADGSFERYQDAANREDNYVTGTYDVYCAEFADSYLVTYMGEYGVTEEEIVKLIERSEDGQDSDDNFTCLVLHNESRICDGMEKIVTPYDSNYIGYYAEGRFDATDMESEEKVTFREQ